MARRLELGYSLFLFEWLGRNVDVHHGCASPRDSYGISSLPSPAGAQISRRIRIRLYILLTTDTKLFCYNEHVGIVRQVETGGKGHA